MQHFLNVKLVLSQEFFFLLSLSLIQKYVPIYIQMPLKRNGKGKKMFIYTMLWKKGKYFSTDHQKKYERPSDYQH